MNTIDIVLLSFIGVFATFGVIRGVVSQIMSIAGLVAAYFFAEPLSKPMVAKAAMFLGSSHAYAKPFAVLWAAILIYIGCRLAGFLIEKFFLNHSDPLKSMNRIGGGFLGVAKGFFILWIVFYVLQLVPKNILEERAPKLAESYLYQLMNRHQFLDPKYLETLSQPVKEIQKPVSATVASEKKTVEKTESKMNNAELGKVLMKHSETKKESKAKR